MRKLPPQPWFTDDVDVEDYPVIRDAKGAPVAFIEKTLPVETQFRIANMMVVAPDLLEAVREVIFAQERGDAWNYARWRAWRMKHGPSVATAMGMI